MAGTTGGRRGELPANIWKKIWKGLNMEQFCFAYMHLKLFHNKCIMFLL